MLTMAQIVTATYRDLQSCMYRRTNEPWSHITEKVSLTYFISQNRSPKKVGLYRHFHSSWASRETALPVGSYYPTPPTGIINLPTANKLSVWQTTWQRDFPILNNRFDGQKLKWRRCLKLTPFDNISRFYRGGNWKRGNGKCGTVKNTGWKSQDSKTRDQIVGVENAWCSCLWNAKWISIKV